MSAMTIYLRKLTQRQDLTEEEASSAMELIMRDQATPSQIAGFIIALRVKGESPAEVVGLARAVYAFALPVPLLAGQDLLDVVGTGGDGLGTFNISTLAAIVAGACGARVAKHGNRSISSACGSADLLEALGVCIDLGPSGVARCVTETGIGFLFAPRFHPSFRFAALPRRELGVRTIFNILGPLCNPARASSLAVGMAEPSLLEIAGEVLLRQGARRALLFHGSGGMDELSTTGPSRIVEIFNGQVRDYELDAFSLGLDVAATEDLSGGDAAYNAAIATELLSGAGGPRRDVVLLNAAAALRTAGLATSWEDGIGLAAEAIDQGRAGALLESWVRVSREAAADEDAAEA
jgi:anthranilate phosphoribosyltransferase